MKIKPEGIRIYQEFRQVPILKSKLKEYTDFFKWDSESPFTYFYLIAQRAQVMLMLDKRFTVAIPGLFHLSNKLEQLNSVDLDSPFDIKATVNVDHKETGPMTPTFTIEFWQNGVAVINCTSIYLAKRKSGTKKNKTSQELPSIGAPDYSTEWKIPSKLGRAYGKKSGDKNPIHTSVLFAKTVGLSTTILQGWYSVNRLVKEYEEVTQQKCCSVEIDFTSPVYIPSTQKVEWNSKSEPHTVFQITDISSHKTVMKGILKHT